MQKDLMTASYHFWVCVFQSFLPELIVMVAGIAGLRKLGMSNKDDQTGNQSHRSVKAVSNSYEMWGRVML